MRATNGTHPSGAAAVRSGDIAAEVVHDAQRLVSLEIALALLVAVPSLVVVLVPWHWQAALGWVVAYALLGVGLVFIGKSRFALKLPTKTLKSLKENKEWVLRRMKSTVR